MKELWQIVLGFSPLIIPAKVDFSMLVHNMMTGNLFFPNPEPSLDEVKKTATELNDLYLESRDGSKETTKLMYQKERELHVLMKRLGNYVENVALTDNENGAAIINSAGFNIKQLGGSSAQQFTVDNTGIAGRVLCKAAVESDRAAYRWELSTNGNDYTVADTTSISETVIDGLEPGTRYWFRVASVLRNEQLPYQGPIILFVT